jgi:hypothetical protein
MDTSLPPGALPEPRAPLSSVVTAIGLLKAFSESDIEIGTSALGHKQTSTPPNAKSALRPSAEIGQCAAGSRPFSISDFPKFLLTDR